MPLYREIIRRAMAGEFGQMNLAQINFGSYKEFDPRSRSRHTRDLAGGALLDIGVYAITLARLFMMSLPEDVLSIANACSTGVDVTSGIVLRNPDMQMATITLSLHSKQPKRAVLSFDDCYIEVADCARRGARRHRLDGRWTPRGDPCGRGGLCAVLRGCEPRARRRRRPVHEQNMIAYTVECHGHHDDASSSVGYSLSRGGAGVKQLRGERWPYALRRCRIFGVVGVSALSGVSVFSDSSATLGQNQGRERRNMTAANIAPFIRGARHLIYRPDGLVRPSRMSNKQTEAAADAGRERAASYTAGATMNLVTTGNEALVRPLHHRGHPLQEQFGARDHRARSRRRR